MAGSTLLIAVILVRIEGVLFLRYKSEISNNFAAIVAKVRLRFIKIVMLVKFRTLYLSFASINLYNIVY